MTGIIIVLVINASLHLFVKFLRGIIVVVMVDTLAVNLVASLISAVVIPFAFSFTMFSIVEYHRSDPGSLKEIILFSLNKKFIL